MDHWVLTAKDQSTGLPLLPSFLLQVRPNVSDVHFIFPFRTQRTGQCRIQYPAGSLSYLRDHVPAGQ
jgi:hypothetical protein